MTYVDNQYSKLFVVSGYKSCNAELLASVEVIDLSSSTTFCSAPVDYPIAQLDPLGAFFGGVPTICGGHKVENLVEVYNYTDACFVYDMTEDAWLPAAEMKNARGDAATVVLDDNTWWITGGHGGDPNILISTERRNANGHPSWYLNLPMANKYHCLARADDGHVLMAGGEVPGAAWLFHIPSETWSQMPDLPGT